jgi:hypothetical protein
MRAEVIHFLNRVATVSAEESVDPVPDDPRGSDPLLHEVRFPTGVVFTVYITPSGTVLLDRVETPERIRGRGLLRPTFTSFLAACRAGGAPVSLIMQPGETEKASLFPKLTALLERAGYMRDSMQSADPGAYLFSPAVRPQNRGASALIN